MYTEKKSLAAHIFNLIYFNKQTLLLNITNMLVYIVFCYNLNYFIDCTNVLFGYLVIFFVLFDSNSLNN